MFYFFNVLMFKYLHALIRANADCSTAHAQLFMVQTFFDSLNSCRDTSPSAKEVLLDLFRLLALTMIKSESYDCK